MERPRLGKRRLQEAERAATDCQYHGHTNRTDSVHRRNRRHNKSQDPTSDSGLKDGKSDGRISIRELRDKVFCQQIHLKSWLFLPGLGISRCWTSRWKSVTSCQGENQHHTKWRKWFNIYSRKNFCCSRCSQSYRNNCPMFPDHLDEKIKDHTVSLPHSQVKFFCSTQYLD